MKQIVFMGKSLMQIKEFAPDMKRQIRFQLDRVQRDFTTTDWKPMQGIGSSVREISIKHEGQFRVIYIANINNQIYVLHAFQKMTQKTAQTDINTAKRNFKLIG